MAAHALYACHAGDPTQLERKASWHRLETYADFRRPVRWINGKLLSF
jgi:hypothetical protein